MCLSRLIQDYDDDDVFACSIRASCDYDVAFVGGDIMRYYSWVAFYDVLGSEAKEKEC